MYPKYIIKTLYEGISIMISDGSVSYFLKTIMLISWVGTLTQTRMEIRRVTFPHKGPIRGQIIFRKGKTLRKLLRVQSVISVNGYYVSVL